MKTKTSELTGVALDWAVMVSDGWECSNPRTLGYQHDDATPEDIDRVVQLYRKVGRQLRKMYPSIQQYIHEYGRRKGVHSILGAERRLERIGKP